MYLAMQFVHILSVIVFLGNIILAVFWKAHADRTRDPRLMAHALAGIIRSDRFFTMPGVTLLVVTGFGAAGIGKMSVFGTGWLFWSLVLVVISAVAYMAGVSPAQKKMAALAQIAAAAGAGPSAGPGEFDRERYDALTRSWNLWGTIALLAPLVAAALMVFKPSLPAL